MKAGRGAQFLQEKVPGFYKGVVIRRGVMSSKRLIFIGANKMSDFGSGGFM